jgi:uncharacterized iron-regulated membrane protein
MTRVLHRRTGLILGVPLLLLGLSGAGLVYREKMERSAKPVPLTIDARGRSPLPLDEVAARVLAAEPGAIISYVQIPPRRHGPLEFVIEKGGRRQMLAADPFTGEPLGLLRGGPPTPVEPVRRIHANWLLGAAGRQLNGLLAVALALMALSGLSLFARNPRSWHGWLGLLAAAPLMLAAVSGAMLIWGRIAPIEPPRTGAIQALTLDQYAAAARSALPDAEISWIAIGDPVTVRMRLPSDWQRRGSNDVHLDPATGAPLRVDLYRNAPLARKIYVALSALHYGEAGGAPGRMAWAASGGVIAILWITGLGVWWTRRNQGKS